MYHQHIMKLVFSIKYQRIENDFLILLSINIIFDFILLKYKLLYNKLNYIVRFKHRKKIYKHSEKWIMIHDQMWLWHFELTSIIYPASDYINVLNIMLFSYSELVNINE